VPTAIRKIGTTRVRAEIGVFVHAMTPKAHTTEMVMHDTGAMSTFIERNKIIRVVSIMAKAMGGRVEKSFFMMESTACEIMGIPIS